MPLVECYRHFLGDYIKVAVVLTVSNTPFDLPFIAHIKLENQHSLITAPVLHYTYIYF